MRKGYCAKCKKQVDHVHRFPENRERAREWAANMNWTDEFREIIRIRGEHSTQNIAICTVHFAETSYMNNTRSERLRYGAMPEILTPVPEQDHDYLDPTHPQQETSMDWQPITNQPFNNVTLSQSSWEEPLVESQESIPEHFYDLEGKREIKRRRERESKSMEELKTKNSLISHSSFLELINYIPGCIKCKNLDARRTFTTVGCVFILETSCPRCKKWKWTSTSTVHDYKNGSFYQGNMDLTVASFASGIPYERTVDFCKIMQMGITRKESHYQILREHAKPVIQEMFEEDGEDVRQRIQARYTTQTGSGTPIFVVGDAQYDSRGFCASICRYALLDDGTRYIIDHQIEARKENNGNSPAMEAKALAQIMARLTKDNRFNITQLTTDKNSAVVSHMKKVHPTISHKLDKWHVLKNFKKNNKHVIELKRNANLRAHWENLLVHIWYSIEAADGNSELAVEMIRSAEYHLQDLHQLPKNEFQLIDQCLHDPITSDPNKAYLDATRHKEQIKVLHDMLNSPTFLDNIRVCAARETTSACESFNSLVALIYIKKNHYYDKSTTTTLMQLAILHHNSHRREILDKAANGITPATRKNFSRSQGRTVEVTYQAKPTLKWKGDLLARVKSHYRSTKDANMDTRKIGRPPRTDTPIVVDDVLDVDDVLLDELDGSDAEPEEDVELEDDNDANEEMDRCANGSSNTMMSVLPPIQVKPVIRCSPRQFPIVYRSNGTNADLYTYINNRTGEVMIPLPTD